MTISTQQQKLSRRAGAALGLAAMLAIAGFTALGSIFDYPQILQEPVDDILATFRDHQVGIMLWFGVLALSAALLAPAGIWIGRLRGDRIGTAIQIVAVAASLVQVVGLQRWLTIVPVLARDALDPAQHDRAAAQFTLWHTVLGKAIGETIGYALTATFTVLVIIALGRLGLPRWLAVLGFVAAALIATGVLVPVVHGASLTNFAGYVLWCVWLLVLAAILLRGRLQRPSRSTSDLESVFPRVHRD